MGFSRIEPQPRQSIFGGKFVGLFVTVTFGSRVTDEYQSTTGGKMQESRPVKAAMTPLTKGTLLQLLHPNDRQAASQIIEQMEILRFEPLGTGSTLKFGFTSDDGNFHSLLSLDKSGVWVAPLKTDKDLLGAEGLANLRKDANKFGIFYRDDQMDRFDSFGCAVKYQQLLASAGNFVAFLDGYRSKITELLESKADA